MATEREPPPGVQFRTSKKRKPQQVQKAEAFREAAQAHALAALEVLAGLSKSATSEAVRVSAANAVIDRAHGRPASGARAVRGEDEAGGPDGVEVQWLDPAKS